MLTDNKMWQWQLNVASKQRHCMQHKAAAVAATGLCGKFAYVERKVLNNKK